MVAMLQYQTGQAPKRWWKKKRRPKGRATEQNDADK